VHHAVVDNNLCIKDKYSGCICLNCLFCRFHFAKVVEFPD